MALFVVGLPATIPLGGVGGCFALVSSELIIASKKLEAKIKKHQEITTLAVTKRDTVSRLLSKALNNNAVSAHQFDIIQGMLLANHKEMSVSFQLIAFLVHEDFTPVAEKRA